MLVALIPRFLAVFLVAVSMQDSNPAPANPPPGQSGSSVSTPSQKPELPATGTSAKPVLKPKAEAWRLLEVACASKSSGTRALGVGALGLLPHNPRARAMAEKALADPKPEVRAAAASSLGLMGAKASIQKLRDATEDRDPGVAVAAAHSLIDLHDHAGYEVYYEILTGQRKGKGLIASQEAILKDPKKLATFGLNEGIGFIPYAGMGWEAYKVIHSGDTSPLRAAAAKILIKDPDPQTTKALEDALTDKHWNIRVAALQALAQREDPSVLDAIIPYMEDEKSAVKYVAAAAVLRLYASKESRTPHQKARQTRTP